MHGFRSGRGDLRHHCSVRSGWYPPKNPRPAPDRWLWRFSTCALALKSGLLRTEGLSQRTLFRWPIRPSPLVIAVTTSSAAGGSRRWGPDAAQRQRKPGPISVIPILLGDGIPRLGSALMELPRVCTGSSAEAMEPVNEGATIDAILSERKWL